MKSEWNLLCPENPHQAGYAVRWMISLGQSRDRLSLRTAKSASRLVWPRCSRGLLPRLGRTAKHDTFSCSDLHCPLPFARQPQVYPKFILNSTIYVAISWWRLLSWNRRRKYKTLAEPIANTFILDDDSRFEAQKKPGDQQQCYIRRTHWIPSPPPPLQIQSGTAPLPSPSVRPWQNPSPPTKLFKTF